MTIDEHIFICTMLSYFSNWQVFLFKGETLVKRISNSPLPFNTAENITNKIFSTKTNFSVIDDGLYFYGIAKYTSPTEEIVTYVIGPVPTSDIDRPECLRILQRLGEPREYLDPLYDYLSYATKFTSDNFNKIFFTLSYLFTKDTNIDPLDYFGNNMTTAETLDIQPPPKKSKTRATARPHNSWEFEQKLYSLVEEGNVNELTNLSLNGWSVNFEIGKLANSSLRQTKNITIVSTVLASRAAIRGGVSPETAYSMSDHFIQTAESTDSLDKLNALSSKILLDFTKKVADEKYGLKGNKLAIQVKEFIQKNIDMRVTTEDVAQTLNINRTQLCNKFKHITGKTLAVFILELKIEDAKRLLKTTNKSLSEISYHLAFSSQSHFQNTFKRLTGITPAQYREENYI